MTMTVDANRAPGADPMAITFDHVLAAHERIEPFIHRTPLVRSAFLSDLTGGEIHLKLECRQRLNAFKIRGMVNRVLTLHPAELTRGIVVVSSGNHGLAAAYCGERWGFPVEVFVPEGTPPLKLDRIISHGATLHVMGRDYDEACDICQERLPATGLTYVDPADDPAVVAGHGTTGLEIAEALPEVDQVLVPVGSGGLITGVGLAVKGRVGAGVKIIGVQTAACPAMKASLDQGICHRHYPSGPSVCEGLVGGIGEIGFRYAPLCLDGVVLTSERAIRRAVVDLVREDGVMAEPSGAAGVAYVTENPNEFQGRRTAIVISGGNLDPALYSTLLAEEERP